MKTNVFSLVIGVAAALLCLPAHAQITDATLQQNVEYEQVVINNYKDFRFAVAGGIAYRGNFKMTNNPIVDDMNEQMQNGYTIDADAQYFIDKNWGVGLNTNINLFSNSVAGSFTLPNIEGTILTYNEAQRIIYVGPSFAARLETQRFLLSSTLGIGTIFFIVNTTINGVENNGKQTTLGTNITLSGEYKMNNKLGLGIKLSSTSGKIGSVNLNGSNVKMIEDLSLSTTTVCLLLSYRI